MMRVFFALFCLFAAVHAQDAVAAAEPGAAIRAIFWKNSAQAQTCLLLFREDYSLVGYAMLSAQHPPQSVFLEPGETAKVFVSVVINPLDIKLKSVDHGYAIMISDGQGKSVPPSKLGTIVSTFKDGSFVGCVRVNSLEAARDLHQNFQQLTPERLKSMVTATSLVAEIVTYDQEAALNLP